MQTLQGTVQTLTFTSRIYGPSGQGNTNQAVRWPETGYIWSSKEVLVVFSDIGSI